MYSPDRMIVNSRYHQPLLVLFLLCVAALFHGRYLNEFPQNIHAWAQADRYALALRFADGGLNLFRPETYVMNHQFPGQFQVPNPTSVTAVDLPIHDYLVGLIMKLTGTRAPWVFRLYVLLYSLVGVFALYKLALLVTLRPWRALFATTLVCTAPVFVYYQSGFLPTMPSLANVWIGLYFYMAFRHAQRRSQYALGLGFLTLATMARTTFAIVLFAVMLFEVYHRRSNRRALTQWLASAGICALAIGSYYLYNQYLRQTYGSMFLAHFRPASGLSEMGQLLKVVANQWQYATMVFGGIVCLQRSRAHRWLMTKTVQQLGMISLISLAGCLAFFVLMALQYHDHDYYFLDTFYVPVTLLWFCLVGLLPSTPAGLARRLTLLGALFLSFVFIAQALHFQQERRLSRSWDRTQSTYQNYCDSQELLRTAGVPDTARMLVLATSSPNAALILMNRKGYSILNPDRQQLTKALAWPADFVVFENQFMSRALERIYPALMRHLEVLTTNGRITVATIASDIVHMTFDQLNGLDGTPLFESEVAFNGVSVPGWRSVEGQGSSFYDGLLAFDLHAGIEYGPTFEIMSSDLPGQLLQPTTLKLTAEMRQLAGGQCHVIVALSRSGQLIFLRDIGVGSADDDSPSGEHLVYLPTLDHTETQLSVYLWNPENGHWHIRRMSIALYRS